MSYGRDELHLIDHYRAIAEGQPDKLAIIDHLGQVTYAELLGATDAVAGGLIGKGVKPGDRVGLALGPGLAQAVLILACLDMGAIPCPLNIRLAPVEVTAYTTPLEPALVVFDTLRADLVEGLTCAKVDVGDLSPSPIATQLAAMWAPGATYARPKPDDDALIIPTGGTTGIPKGSVLIHRALWLWCSSCNWGAMRTETDIELFFSPFFHVSIVTGWMATLFGAGTVKISPSFQVDQAVEDIESGVTWLMAVPTMWTQILRHPRFPELDTSKVRQIGFGATAATPEFIRGLMAAFPNARIFHTYGATEFGPVTVFTRADLEQGRFTGVGRTMQGVRIRILDDDLKPVPRGEIGEIVVDAPWGASRYWGRPDETAATFTPYGARLGDMGWFDESGWLTISGRKKEMVITGGENVFPIEVEVVLAQHPAVSEVVVYGVPDALWGERVEAAVVLRDGHDDFEGEELIAFGRQGLAGYKLPKRVRVIDALPVTTMNKPDRRVLSAMAVAADKAAL